MGLSVVIPSRTASNLIPCVEAIRAKDETTCEILIIDDGLGRVQLEDGGTGGVWDAMMRPGFRPAGLFEGAKPFIFARNCNIGIVAAGFNNDDVILLNDDALLRSPGGFTAMQKAAEEHPEYGIISATTNVTGNLNQLPRGMGLREEPRMVCFICVLIPRKTIDLVGLLDERFVGYGHDDDDYCVRVRRAGLKIGIFDGCYVDHGSLSSSFRGSALAPANLEHNARIFHEKYGATNREV